jgi:hypothetical protein
MGRDMTLREPSGLTTSATETAAWAACRATDPEGLCMCTRKTGPCPNCVHIAVQVVAALKRGHYLASDA